MNENDHLIVLKCSQCGSNLEMDVNHLSAFCPYCGAKILIDVESFGKIILKKEKTKQIEITEKEKTDRLRIEKEYKQKAYLLVFVIILLLLVGRPLVIKYINEIACILFDICS